MVAREKAGIEVNADKTAYSTFMSREQNIGQNRNINIVDKSFEYVEKFKCLEVTLTRMTFTKKLTAG